MDPGISTFFLMYRKIIKKTVIRLRSKKKM